MQVIPVEVGTQLNLAVVLVADDGAAAIVDPGAEGRRLCKAIEGSGGRLAMVLLTHTHADHLGGLDEVLARGEMVLRAGGEEIGALSGLEGARLGPVGDGDEILLGGETIRALATPGHSPGGRSYLCAGHILSGDVLFVGGCGRADLPGSDPRLLHASLRRLAGLPDDTVVVPGHDYGATVTSTIGREKASNPFLRCATFEEFVGLRNGPNPPRPLRGPR